LPAGSVASIAADDDGAIWIGTETGLSHFDGSKFVTWTTTDGLPGDRVLWVLSDRHGLLWVGFSFGVASIKRTALDAAARKRSGRIEYDLFDSGDGMSGNPSLNWQSPAVQTPDRTIWFQTSKAIGIIDPQRLSKNPVPPPVQIEGMTADGVGINVGQQIRLQPRTRDVQFDYTALSFAEPGRVRFRYMLEGYDAAWQEADTRRQAFYTNLPPRRYRFRVLACNNDGVWNEGGAALQFDLLPAFYQTSLFKVLSLVMILMLGFGAYRWRVWQLTARLRGRFEERLAERTRIAQELHDNLLQSLLGISLQLEVTDELLPADAAARKPLEQALRQSKAAMTEGRRALNELRTQKLGSDDLVRAFAQVAQDFPVGEAPNVDVLTEGEERPLNPVAGQDVLQIARQAITNAVQHAKARRIHVLLSYGRKGLCVRVKDNGRGIDEKTLNFGKAGHHGIAGMRERAGRIGATLSILSRVGEGTEVCLDVPEHLIYDLQGHGSEQGS
jgi:signal transduction histidine kinase